MLFIEKLPADWFLARKTWNLLKIINFRVSCYSITGVLIFKERLSSRVTSNVKVIKKSGKNKISKILFFFDYFEGFLEATQFLFFWKILKFTSRMCAVKGLCTIFNHHLSAFTSVPWHFVDLWPEFWYPGHLI